jgi:outer membrane receptor protein involved in Fe transport
MNSFNSHKDSPRPPQTIRFLLLTFCVLLWSFTAVSASAQAVYGSIIGAVTDKAGALVPNAVITVTDVSKGTTTSVKTNDSGEFRVQHLIPDVYSVQAEAPGFSKTQVNNVVVYADTAPQVNIQLAVGSTATNVVVTGGATLLQTDRADVSTILNERAVEDLPNFNRNFTAFELLTPGTSYIGWGPGEGGGNPQRSESIEVDGQLPFATGYELDGTDNQEPLNGVAVINPNLDAVSEMKVSSQNYDAEFGKAVAGLVTAQTKSGANTMHGSAFEYRRSDAQQARDPFANAPNADGVIAPLPATLHNQFGGSVGGPIVKDKLFYFVDYQGLREKTGASTLTTVPTLKAKTTCTSGGDCDLSDYLAASPSFQIYKPISLNDVTDAGRTPFANNVIPASMLSPASVALLKLLPAPNVSNTAVENNYSASGSGIFTTNQPDVRIDYKPTDKLHVFGRYTFFQGNLSGAPYFGAAGGNGYGSGGFAGTDAFHYSSLASGGDYVVSTNWLTDFRFGYYRIYNDTAGPDADTAAGNNLGIPNANPGDLSLTGGLPQFNIDIPANGSNGGANVEYGTSAQASLQQTSQYQFVNNWSHSFGNHNIKFGVDYRYGKNKSLALSGNGNVLRSGTYDFHATRTAGGTSEGLGYATFLLGDASYFWRTVDQSAVTGATHQNRLFAYAQDQWRLTPKLTVNYGLRWELYTPEAVSGKGGGGLLNIDTGNIDIAGYGNFNNSLNVQNNLKEFAPRFGIAWQPRPNTVVRGGYGIVYGQGWAGNTFGDVLTGSYPLQVEQDVEPLSTTYGAVFNLTSTEDGVAPGPPSYTFSPIPANGEYALPDGVSQTVRPLKVRLPTVQGYNLTVQQQLTPGMSLQIAWVGSQAYHNMFDSSNQFNPNEPTLTGFTQGYSQNQRKPYYDGTAQKLGVKFGVPHGWTQGISDNYNEATGSYNALQVIFNKRFTHGLQFLSHYTWSHDLDHESYEFAIAPSIGRGNSYYNRRQAFVFAGNYDMPFGRDKMFASNIPAWANEIIGGFQLNGNVTIDGGLPFNACYNEIGQDNDVAANDGCGPSFLNKAKGSFGIHKGKFNAQSLSVPYLTPSPYALTPPGTPDNQFGAYARPAAGTWGNLGRDSLWGPGLFNVDSSLAKNFNLYEGVKLQMIVQAYNLFNHVNYGQPNTCIDCLTPNAGEIQGTVSEQDGTSLRRLQFGARVQF